MKLCHISGSSSLLFIISALKSLTASDLFFWKVTNTALIFVSYLCNASKYAPNYVLLDYLIIYGVCSSYVNDLTINGITASILLVNVQMAKDIAFMLAFTKSCFNTYMLVDNPTYFYVLYCSGFGSMLIYKIRNYYGENSVLKIPLTYLMHICVMNLMYISSITAL